MSLSRSEAEQHGLAFAVEGEQYGSDPDQDVFVADLTLDGHTARFQGKSEDEILAQAEQFLLNRGQIQKEPEEAVESEPAIAQSADIPENDQPASFLDNGSPDAA